MPVVPQATVIIPGVNGTQLYDSAVLSRPPAWDAARPAGRHYNRLKLDADGRYEADPHVWIRLGWPPAIQYAPLQAGLRSATGGPVFALTYDWRKSCVEAAESLDRCVEEVRHRTGLQQIDFVAYSWGATVLRAWLKRQPEPGSAFRRLVLLGAPLRGTLTGMELLLADTHPLLGLARTVWRTVRSFPSIYELLPTYPGACLEATGAVQSASVFEPATWPQPLVAPPLEADPVRPAFLEAAGRVVTQELLDVAALDAEARNRIFIVGGRGAITPRACQPIPEPIAEPWYMFNCGPPGDGDGVVLYEESLRAAGIRDWTFDLGVLGREVAWQRLLSPRLHSLPLLHVSLPVIPAVIQQVAQFLTEG